MRPKVSLFVHRYLAQRPYYFGYATNYRGSFGDIETQRAFTRKVTFSIPKCGDLLPTPEETRNLPPIVRKTLAEYFYEEQLQKDALDEVIEIGALERGDEKGGKEKE